MPIHPRAGRKPNGHRSKPKRHSSARVHAAVDEVWGRGQKHWTRLLRGPQLEDYFENVDDAIDRETKVKL